MSEPTYRITTERTEHGLAASFNTWECRAVRISDGEPWATTYGSSEEEVLAAMAAQLRREPDTNSGAVYFADEDGNLLDQPPAGHSLRAS